MGRLRKARRRLRPAADLYHQSPAVAASDFGGDPKTSDTLPYDPELSRPVKIRPDLVADSIPITDLKKHAEGVAKGRAKAEEDLNSNKASIVSYGMSAFDTLDRETGLYRWSFGCVIDDEIEGHVEGYNARVSEFIRDHGLPKNSFKPWEKELFGLADYFEKRSRREAGPTGRRRISEIRSSPMGNSWSRW